MKPALLLLLLTSALAAQPQVIYSKSFPGSIPEWVQITLSKDGKAIYTDQKEDPQPLSFTLSAEQTATIFGLAEKLHFFNRPLESGLPVAKMGEKSFRWVDGDKHFEAKFNYTQDLDAQALHDWFERMTETESHRINLERAARFDKLGVNKALLQLQATWERKRIVAPEQFFKTLERIVKNESYLNIARDRAAMLVNAFRSEAPPQP
jgi:hypothetical protein